MEHRRFLAGRLGLVVGATAPQLIFITGAVGSGPVVAIMLERVLYRLASDDYFVRHEIRTKNVQFCVETDMARWKDRAALLVAAGERLRQHLADQDVSLADLEPLSGAELLPF